MGHHSVDHIIQELRQIDRLPRFSGMNVNQISCFFADLSPETNDSDIQKLVKEPLAQKYITNVILHGTKITFEGIDELSKLPYLTSIIKERWYINIYRKNQNQNQTNSELILGK